MVEKPNEDENMREAWVAVLKTVAPAYVFTEQGFRETAYKNFKQWLKEHKPRDLQVERTMVSVEPVEEDDE